MHKELKGIISSVITIIIIMFCSLWEGKGYSRIKLYLTNRSLDFPFASGTVLSLHFEYG